MSYNIYVKMDTRKPRRQHSIMRVKRGTERGGTQRELGVDEILHANRVERKKRGEE